MASPEVLLDTELFEELENGLHAMAQPLTVLRGVVGALKMRGAVGAENVRYLDMSDEQIQRLCYLMSGMRGLLGSSQSVSAQASFDIWNIVTAILEEHELLSSSRITITAPEPECSAMVVGDPEKVEAALEAALVTASWLASQGDVIHLEVVATEEFVDLQIRNEKPCSGRINSAHRLNLALARTNTLMQGGVFEFLADPFILSMKLPAMQLFNCNLEFSDASMRHASQDEHPGNFRSN